jgi:negative regulator of sigma E activity
MIDRDQLRATLDTCRPDSRDLELPELAVARDELAVSPELQADFDRQQRVDRRIRQALDEVPVPAGLADRVLAACASERAVLNAAVPLPPNAPAMAPSAGSAAARPWTRRRLTWAAAAAVLLAAVVPVALHFLATDALSAAEVPALANRWFSAVASGRWQAMESAPRDLALPRSIVAVARGWQSVGGLAGRGVAYDLSRPGLGQAVMFVVKLAVYNLPSAPPLAPQSTTGGQAIVAWQSDGHLLVLVVQLDGDPGRVRRFINLAPPPVA